jgi:signal transduction histidine kinase
MDLFRRVFFSDEFMPHGHCYLWNPGLVWLHLVSDAIVGAVYATLAFLLYRLVRRVHVPHRALLVSAGVFLGACGLTHLMEVVTLWDPLYWVAGGVKAVTAVASVATLLLLSPLRSKVKEIANAAQISQDLKVQLREKSSEAQALRSRIEGAAQGDPLVEGARAACLEAEKASRAKSALLSVVSHQLRSSLSALQTDLSALQREEVPPGARGPLDRLRLSTHRMLELAESVNEFTRLESGRVVTDVRSFDPAEVTAEVVDELRPHAQQKLLELRMAPSAPCPPLASDPRLLRLALLNLGLSAIEHTQTGHVGVALSYEGGRHRFSVSDTGPGVTPEAQARLLAKAPPETESREKQRKPGLGLALVREIVAALGGSIELRSVPSAGCTFTLSLPTRSLATP